MHKGKFTSTAHAIRFALIKMDAQGERCKGSKTSDRGEDYTSCLYHRADGARCIVGWMLTATEAAAAEETSRAGVYDWSTDELDQIAPDAWEHKEALIDLQSFHDEGWINDTRTFSQYVREHLNGRHDLQSLLED